MYFGRILKNISEMIKHSTDTPEIIDEALNRFENVFKHVKKTDKGLV